MRKAKEEGEAAGDAIDLHSIGSLYSGPFHNKYWSSSRGKDRHPYPVGYQAVRSHNGISCKVEIHQGPKGPLFMITTPDGSSFCGQTPNLAWDTFQKKGFPHLKKIWHIKRITCNVDSAEFFGFKNPSVQRLLRELVTASSGGAAEQTILSSRFCNATSEVALEMGLGLGFKRRDQGLVKGILRRNSEHATCTDDPTLNCVANTITDPICEDEKKPQVPTDSEPDGIGCGTPLDQKQLDRFGETEKHASGSSTSVEYKSIEITELGDSECNGGTGTEICAPDTYESFSDVADASQKSVCGISPAEPQKEEINLDSSKGISENTDCDSVDEDITKSMMTLLLPRAISLFTHTSRKKRKKNNKSDASSETVLKSHGDKKMVSPSINSVIPPEAGIVGHFTTPISHANFDHTEAVAPESSDADTFDPQDMIHCHMNAKGENEGSISQDTLCGLLNEEDMIALNYIVDELIEEESSQTGCLVAKGNDCRSPVPEGSQKLAPSMTEKKKLLALLENSGNHVQHDSQQNPENAGSFRDHTTRNFSKSSVSQVVDEYSMQIDVSDKDMIALDYIVQEIIEEESIQTGCLVAKGNDCCSPVPEGSQKLCIPSMTEEKKLALLGNSGNHVEHDSRQNPENAGSFRDHTTRNFSKSSVSQVVHAYSMQIDVSDKERKTYPENVLEAEETAAVTLNNSSPIGNNYQLGVHSEFRETFPGAIIDLVGCYNHPWPVLSVLLSPSEDHVNLCVVCGCHMDAQKTLFFYKVSMENPMIGCPSFVGHSLASFPGFSSLSRTADLKSCLGFTPSGKNLVMLGSIKAPYCRKKKMTCSCSTCASVPSSENAIRVVQVNFGYVTVLVELKSFDRIVSVLVCEPYYLVALGESGRMQLWLMNQSWSVSREEFCLPTRDCFSSLVELQKVPQFPCLVVGLNGFSEFSLWYFLDEYSLLMSLSPILLYLFCIQYGELSLDALVVESRSFKVTVFGFGCCRDISKRTLVSKFSCLDHSICRFIPISAVRWRLGPMPVKDNMEELINQLAYGKVLDFSHDGNRAIDLENEGSIAIWVLVATEPDCYSDTNASWRLALLAKTAVITGSVIDPKAATIGALSGHGIVGTVDGSMYTWEFSTGTKVVTLHHLQGERVSCIATGGSNSHIFAASGEGGKLVIYRQR